MRAKDLAINLLLALGAVALLLGGLEWTARRLNLSSPFLLIPRPSNCLARSSTYSLVFRPNCTGSLRDTSFSTNSLGMRGPEVRADGSKRILAIGDSCTWGWGVAQDETYPAALEKLLAERAAGARVQVLNAGVPGYTSHQGLTYLREKGLALDPAIVIAGYGWNDATSMGDVERQIAEERRRMSLIRLDDWLLLRSKLYRWLRYRAVERSPKSEPRVPLKRYIANLDAIVDVATHRGARVVLLNFWYRATRPLWHEAIRHVAERRGVPMVYYQGPRFDLVHPTVEGQRLLAEQIAAEMEKSGLLN